VLVDLLTELVPVVVVGRPAVELVAAAMLQGWLEWFLGLPLPVLD